MRSVYALWNPKEEQTKAICKTLGEPFERGRVVMGGVVKANGRANLRVTTFLRDARGLLVDRSQDVARAGATDVDLLPALKAAIARAAAEGKPYTKTGGNGVYERRHELPDAFHAIGKHRLTDWVGTLLDREERVMAMAQGSKLVKWLDVPSGPVASGQAVFVTGHLGRSGAERPGGDCAFPASRFPAGKARPGGKGKPSTDAGNQRSRTESFPGRDGNGPSPGETGRSRLPGGLSLKRG